MKEAIKNIGIILLLILLLLSIYDIFINNKLSRILTGNDSKDYIEIVDGGKLIVVTDYSPTGYFVKEDTLAGFNYELLQSFRQYTKLNIEIELESSLTKSIEGLSSGKYHLIARNTPITSDLKDKVLFSNPISQNKQMLVQRKQSYNHGIEPVKSHLDLAKKTLYVSKNSPVILRISNLSKEIGDTIYYIEDELYGAEQLAIMVAHREIDYAVCDEKTATRIAKLQPELDVSTMIGFTHLEAWAVPKNSPILLDTLNSWIDRAKKTPKYNEMYKKYFDK